MSEFFVEEDPEPLPGRDYSENLQTGLTYEGHELSRFYAELEASQQERAAIAKLSIEADRILSGDEAVGDYDDRMVRHTDVLLRRRLIATQWPDRITHEPSYFFVDRRDGANYCRSWSRGADKVNWCLLESRHEPAASVLKHIHDIFPRENATEKTTLGRRILQLLSR